MRSEIAEGEEEDEELNVKKVKTKQKDKYVQTLFCKKMCKDLADLIIRENDYSNAAKCCWTFDCF